ncbi:transcriptional regulator [Streptomyces chengbuensis]|uniref:transcriptional regulator n=1 Tax=Streptomyces TaxID=1883 RepID=UPI0025B3825F|nr:transcriptional regulator [Streptomyces sp. HUAS CB01]WJY54511.1 transcriptional regulator [Streptomyces sp. HUAS CB01]
MTTSPPRGDQWTFLTHHARVLPRTAGDPEVRVRDAAAGIGHRARRGLEQVLRRTALSALPDDANAGVLGRPGASAASRAEALAGADVREVHRAEPVGELTGRS